MCSAEPMEKKTNELVSVIRLIRARLHHVTTSKPNWKDCVLVNSLPFQHNSSHYISVQHLFTINLYWKITITKLLITIPITIVLGPGFIKYEQEKKCSNEDILLIVLRGWTQDADAETPQTCTRKSKKEFIDQLQFIKRLVWGGGRPMMGWEATRIRNRWVGRECCDGESQAKHLEH